MPRNLRDLVQPGVGLINQVMRMPVQPGEHTFTVLAGSLGRIQYSVPSLEANAGRGLRIGTLEGAGAGLDWEQAEVRCIAESLERYSACVYDDRQFIWATADELGDEALDLDLIPQCSVAELTHPKCPITAPSKHLPIRWVRGISLLDHRLVWIPAVMVYLNIPPLSPGERFWLPISTGCAAHPSVASALVGGICEVIERDAISLVWLHQLPLPLLELDVLPGVLQAHLARTDQSQVRTLLFDATTDIGVPTIYALDLSRDNPSLATSVACVTDLDPIRAACKIHYESTSCRIALQSGQQPPNDPDDFIDVWHGGVYMGRPANQHAFRFLEVPNSTRPISQMSALASGDAETDLHHLLELFRVKNMDVFAVDLTTDEALRVGMRVVRVLIPGLQPLTFTPRARYLAHPRVYDAPTRMGYGDRSEEDLNPNPQPFA